MRQPNKTLLQTFEWHTPASAAPSHYGHLSGLLPRLAEIGISAIWLPPGCKANNPQGNGYDIYDLWDLGEFEQKGARGTKWGSREDLDELILKSVELDVDVIWDAVLNHKQGGDQTEGGIWAVEVDKQDRRHEICEPKKIEAWLRYDFPGREAEGMKYSQMKWRAEHFNGTDWDQSREKNAIYKLIDDPLTHPTYQQPALRKTTDQAPPRNRLARLRRRFSSQSGQPKSPPEPPSRRPGKGWADDVDDENGNNDYLLFSNVDFTHPEVRQDVIKWGQWMIREVGVYGFRLDAVQHYSFNFTRDWVQEVNATSLEKQKKDTFVVGEVWSGDVQRVLKWLDAVQVMNGPQVYAYDSPLLYNFSRISEDFRTRPKRADLRHVFDNSLVASRATAAITLVTNHDTQPGQTCYTPMHATLKLHFYAMILLRQTGYPCVFWGDLYGTSGPHTEKPACLVQDGGGKTRSLLPDLIMCRKMFAYGEQKDYWDDPMCIGWTRAGYAETTGLAVVLSMKSKATVKQMKIGRPGEQWIDALGQVSREVKIDATGVGAFPCNKESVSVFVRKTDGDSSIFPVHLEIGM